MPKLTPQEEGTLVTRLESEGYDPGDYEDVPAPADLRTGRHGVRLTVRLDVGAADLLGDLADAEYDGSLVLAAEELLAEGLAAYAVRTTHERRRRAAG
ncbi:MAG: hypothetical protein ACRDZO_22465 [Egibacteraceae bacterium]